MQTIEQVRAVATNVKADIYAGIFDIEKTVQELAPLYEHTPVEQIRDNLILEQFGYIAYLESNPDCPPFTMKEVKLVYEAAKVIFAEHSGQPMHFDITCDSPWSYVCDTPETYAIAYGRRMLEDDECAINDSSDNTAKQVYEFCIEMIEIVGIPEQMIRENLAYICYDNKELTAKVKNLLG